MDRFPGSGMPRWKIRQGDAIAAKMEYYRSRSYRHGGKAL